jgi:SAM-dependent methyltransferase
MTPDDSEFALPPDTRMYSPEVSQVIVAGDQMFNGDRNQYFYCGASALNCIMGALRLAVVKPRRILDYGCGAGRVTRWLRPAFADAEIHACEIRDTDLTFVRDHFGVLTFRAHADPLMMVPPNIYDLIWVGSVFTHINSNPALILFDQLARWLQPKGVMVFSVHGRATVANLDADHMVYGLERDEATRAREGYLGRGYGYANYPGHSSYGVSFTKSSWWVDAIERRPDLKLKCLSEEAWDNHQDVIAVQRH